VGSAGLGVGVGERESEIPNDLLTLVFGRTAFSQK